MSPASDAAPRQSLAARWEALKGREPSLRARDAAGRLGVSEAEFLAARSDLRVWRLGGPWGRVVQRLPDLGEVMALTRNDHVVHEKIGQFGTISIADDLGLVRGDDIDLRMFFHHWHYGFAVTETIRDRTRRSLQFFDREGTAVHKVYLRVASDGDEFDALVRAHLHPDQSLLLTVQGGPSRTTTRSPSNGEINPSDLLVRWRSPEDSHDFHDMQRDLGLGRVQALHMVPGDGARRVRNDSFQASLTRAAREGLPVMVFVSNPGIVQIHTGPVHRLKRVGPWFNVLDPGFNLHLREDTIASTWVVRKPTRAGTVTSVEIFAEDGQQIAWLFGQRKSGEEESVIWRELAASLGN